MNTYTLDLDIAALDLADDAPAADILAAFAALAVDAGAVFTNVHITPDPSAPSFITTVTFDATPANAAAYDDAYDADLATA